jgi:predicted nucleic acid-binding protein
VIVLDASAAVDLLLDIGEEAEWVRERLTAVDEMHAPHLLDIEVGSALRRRLLLGEIDDGRGALALDHLAALPIVRYAHDPLTRRMWDLRGRVTFRDAAYVALAEALGLAVVTTDQRLGRAGFGGRVLAFPGRPSA